MEHRRQQVMQQKAVRRDSLHLEAVQSATSPRRDEAAQRHAWVSASASTPARPPASVHDGQEPAPPLPATPTRLRAEFLRHLRREKRRAERSGRPLSVVLYRVQAQDSTRVGDDSLLIDLLHLQCRETDIVGHLGDRLVAVLCPDTDERGVRGFIAKVESATGEPWFTCTWATYPDELFEMLDCGTTMPPHLLRLLVDDAWQRPRPGYALKRPLDITLALAALVLVSPLMLVVALAIALTSPGPVIYRQRRLGLHGRPFVFYKFRSMRTDADDSIHRAFVASLVKGDGDGTSERKSAEAPLYKLRADPRVTPVGRFIRKTSIDELPQLFNVLRGDMSLVGPRPPIPYETEHYEAWHLRRILSGMPGITGLWQVAGRSTVSFDEMVRMDLRYLRECSLGLDLRILLKTALVVLRCEGAV